MFTFKDIFTEAFTKPYKYNLERITTPISAYVARAQLDDGRDLVIQVFDRNNGKWDLNFTVDGSYRATGKGDAFKIFATVFAVAKEFAEKEKDHKVITFNADKTQEDDEDVLNSREKLYKRMVQRYGKEMGYKVNARSTKDRTSFKLTKK